MLVRMWPRDSDPHILRRWGDSLSHCVNSNFFSQVWSFARQGLIMSVLLKRTAEEAVLNLSQYSMKNMSNLLWGFARSEYYDEALFAAVAERVTSMLQVNYEGQKY